MSDIKLPETKTPANLGTGRRKTAVARVRLAAGTGKIIINGRPLENYFPTEALRVVAVQPLDASTGTTDKFDAQITVTGGGPNGQAGAVRHGIARALLTVDVNFRPVLKAEGLLTRDSREKERKKYRPAGRAQTLPIQQALIALEFRPAGNPAGLFSKRPLVASLRVLFVIVYRLQYETSCHCRCVGLFRRRTGAVAPVASACGAERRNLAPIRRANPGAGVPQVRPSSAREGPAFQRAQGGVAGQAGADSSSWRCRTAWRRNSPCPCCNRVARSLI